MPRAIWKGSVAFGLVNIPVQLHTGVRDSRTSRVVDECLLSGAMRAQTCWTGLPSLVTGHHSQSKIDTAFERHMTEEPCTQMDTAAQPFP